MKLIVNCENGEIIERQLTAEELAQQTKDEQTALEVKAAEEAKTATRQAILDRLGITEDEAKLLLG